MQHPTLTAAGLTVFPCKHDKSPAIKTDWKKPAYYAQWPSGIVGVAVPAGVVVIDLDTYKGLTTQAVDAALGCALPWDVALIQTTPKGGQHYAFQAPGSVRNSTNALGLEGFDLRVGGKGYICTGYGYNDYGGGVIRLAAPGSFPELPSGVVELLGHVAATPSTTAAPPASMDDIVAALKHIDPSAGRDVWFRVGQALRSVTEDWTLFDTWSSGVLNGVDTPHNYVPEDIHSQWPTMHGRGDVTIATLFHMAIQGGWTPRAGVDTSSAFTPAQTDLFAEIEGLGADPKHTARLTAACGGDKHLLAALNRELKDAGLLTKAVKQDLDRKADPRPAVVQGEYGKKPVYNASLYLARKYPQGGLRYSEESWFEYNGKAWHECGKEAVWNDVMHDMTASDPDVRHINEAERVLRGLCASNAHINQTPSHLILFQNGVLDMRTGVLGPHQSELFTTNILPYDYDPAATAPQWLSFLAEVLSAEEDAVMLLQEWFGYMLSSATHHRKIMLLLGATASGKSTIGSLLQGIVGDHNFTGASLTQFASDPFLDSLRTKTVAFSGDTAERAPRYLEGQVIENLKKISGNDAVAFSRKYKSSLTQRLPTRITLAANSMPKLVDGSNALSSRLLLLVFNVSFAGREDHTLLQRLSTELPGIATWALEGLRRLSSRGRFTEVRSSIGELQFIAESINPLKQFIDECCRFDQGRTSCEGVHNTYHAWALANGVNPIMTRRQFIGAFKDATRGRGARHGVHRIDDWLGRAFDGLSVLKVEGQSTQAFTPKIIK